MNQYRVQRGLVALFASVCLVDGGGPLLAQALGTPPGYLIPVRANVKQVSADAIQFEMQLAQAPPAEPPASITYIWLVDTDCNAHTGQPHGLIGSEFNVRIVFPQHSGRVEAFVDDIDGRSCSGDYATFVDGTKVYLRLPLTTIGNPSRFTWSCAASAEGIDGRPLEGPFTFSVASYRPKADEAVRIVVNPSQLMLRGGMYSGALSVEAFDWKGTRLDLTHRSLKLFSSSALIECGSKQVKARPRQVGQAKVSAMVDGIMSCNATQVQIGEVEIVPALIHLNLSNRRTGRIALRVADAWGTPISPTGHKVQFRTDCDQKVVALSGDGLVRALPGGVGQSDCVHGEFDGFQTTDAAVIRVVGFAAPLREAVEAKGRYVSFWYPPIDLKTIPQSCRFEEMLSQHDVVRTLDQIYLREWALTGVCPFGSGRQHMAAICEDDTFHVCGLSGNPISLGFDPRKGNSCIQLGSGEPHWGVFGHEIGHNFVGAIRGLQETLFDGKLKTSFDYSEGIASLCQIVARTAIVSKPDHYGVTPTVVADFTATNVYDSLPFDRRIWYDDLGKYISKGKHYPVDFDANVLDGMFFYLGEQYGWSIYPRFFSIFLPANEVLGFDTSTEEKRATFFIAAMGAAAKTDLRSQFRDWGFPCIDTIYDKWLPILKRRAAVRDVVLVKQ